MYIEDKYMITGLLEQVTYRRLSLLCAREQRLFERALLISWLWTEVATIEQLHG